MATVLSGVSGVSLINNKILSFSNSPGYVFGPFNLDIAILMEQASDCILRNNEIKGADNNFAIHFGIFMSGGSRHKIESNRISFDHTLIPNTIFFEGIHGSNNSNDNSISNCQIESNINDANNIYGANSFGIYIDGSGNSLQNCTASNVSGSFVFNGNNNSLKNCKATAFKWSGIEVNGNGNNAKNCEVNGQRSSGLGVRGLMSFYGNNNVFDNCQARNNIMGFQLGSDGSVSSGNRVTGSYASSNSVYGIFLYKNEQAILEKNDAVNNGLIGLNIVQSSNAQVIKNKSRDNTNCDFNETNSSGTSLSGNQFGSSCSNLPWIGPF